MQHVDSESLAPVLSSDRKTLCQTIMEDILDIPDSTVVEVPSDSPPESFWLSKDAEFHWFDRNVFLERKESTKGSFNSMNLNPSHSNSSSQRYSVSMKPKSPIIGLPKTQKTTYVDFKWRQCKRLNVQLFPKQLYSFGKTTAVPVTEPEPSSPKVSCIGRVRSKRCPNRKKSSEPVETGSERSRTGEAQKTGLMSRILSLFHSGDYRCRKMRKSSTEKVKRPVERTSSRRMCVSVKPVNSEPGTPSEPAGLGGMMRFASGRRSDYLGGFEDDDVAGRHSLDSKLKFSVGF